MKYSIPSMDAIIELQKQLSNINIKEFEIPGATAAAVELQKNINVIGIGRVEKNLAKLNIRNLSPELINLLNSVDQNANYSSIAALLELLHSLDSIEVSAQNLAVFKLMSYCGSLPRGLNTTLKSLHKETAISLIEDPNIKFNKKDKVFYSISSPKNKCSVNEANVIYSSLDIFESITSEELMDFINTLEDYPEYAMTNDVGIKIHEIMRNWNAFVTLNNNDYYHARVLPENEMPFTNQDLLKAPNGISSQGRFNHSGRSHYYFSDTEEGAISEVRKHCPNHCRIQVAKMKVVQNAKLFDISYNNKQNVFLKYCSYAPNYNNISKNPREYLLPCFLASTCKKLGIEGIKYYGNKHSNNYVTWKDGYFDIVSTKVIEK